MLLACNCYSVAGDVDDAIKVEQLEIFARVGVTENERMNPQRLTLSITAWTKERFENVHDDITRTSNYSAICAVARDFASGRSDRLIETLATELAAKLLQTFEIKKVRLELRKFVLPDAEYAAVIVTRSRQD
jgi:dihydroneopterin aldolase